MKGGSRLKHRNAVRNGSEMNGIKFRESIKGYNKSDVNDYIETLSRKLSETEQNLKRESENTAQLEAKVAELKAKAESDNADSDALKKAEMRIAELEAEAARLTAALESSSEYKTKAELYDKMSSKLGDMLLHAGDAAEAMLKNAEDEAKRINTEAEELKRTTSEKLRRMLEESNSVFKSMSEEALNALNTYNDETRKTLDDIAAALKARSQSMQTELEKSNRELFDRMIIDIDRIYGEASSVLKTETAASEAKAK